VNCLDAETLAAWFDGGLSGAALEEVHSHVAGCARCQALVGALGRTRAAIPTPQPERSPRWWLAWAVPAAAAATAVAVWVAVPHQTNVAVNPAPVSSPQKLDAPAQSAPASPSAQREPAAPPPTAATSARQARAKAPEAAAPAAAPLPANDAVEPAPRSLNEAVSVQSAASARPAPELRDQAEQRQEKVAGQVQARTAFANNVCGPAWPGPPADVAGQVTAGSSPSAGVCWIVGRAATVLRSTDQRTWQRLTFPVTVDLSTVKATDAQSATVVTADGRTFSTVDGGLTWMQQ